jgi:hypothetical protein
MNPWHARPPVSEQSRLDGFLRGFTWHSARLPFSRRPASTRLYNPLAPPPPSSSKSVVLSTLATWTWAVSNRLVLSSRRPIPAPPRLLLLAMPQATFVAIPTRQGLSVPASGVSSRPPMTSKQAKKQHLAQNRTARMSRAEEKELQEQIKADVRKKHEQEAAEATARRARAQRDKKKEKEAEAVAEKKRQGLPLAPPRPSQGLITKMLVRGPGDAPTSALAPVCPAKRPRPDHDRVVIDLTDDGPQGRKRSCDTAPRAPDDSSARPGSALGFRSTAPPVLVSLSSPLPPAGDEASRDDLLYMSSSQLLALMGSSSPVQDRARGPGSQPPDDPPPAAEVELPAVPSPPPATQYYSSVELPETLLLVDTPTRSSQGRPTMPPPPSPIRSSPVPWPIARASPATPTLAGPDPGLPVLPSLLSPGRRPVEPTQETDYGDLDGLDGLDSLF